MLDVSPMPYEDMHKRMPPVGRTLFGMWTLCLILLLAPGGIKAANVDTVAGTGVFGFSGDGGPATAAQLRDPQGICVDAVGNYYIADNSNFRVRRVDAVTGVITTVAGDGTAGYNGDGIAATSARLSSPFGIDCDGAGNLYLSDLLNGRIRYVDALTGLIDTIAGNGGFGFGGDGGLATLATLFLAQGTAVDAAGNVYIADTSNFRVRRVDALTGIITTIAGTGVVGSGGDGGLATLASLSSPRRLDVDDAGNVYVLNNDPGGGRIRHIDAVSGIIDTVAGGGATIADSGLATDLAIGFVTDVASDAAGTELLIASGTRVWRVDLVGGTIEAVAGDGTFGYSGDGGDALLAQFNNLSGVEGDGAGGFWLADSQNQRVRFVEAAVGLIDIVIDLATLQSFLDLLASIQGSLIMDAVAGRLDLLLSILTDVLNDVTIDNNADLVTISFPVLGSTGGDVTVTNNGQLGSVDFPSLGSTGGSVTITNNGSAGTVDLSSLVDAGGSVTVTNNGAAGTVDLTALASALGNVTLTGNGNLGTVDLSALTSASGVTVTNNGVVGTVDLSGLTDTGDVVVTNNGSAGVVDLSSLVDAGGSVTVTNNGAAGTVDLTALASALGNVTLTGNGNLGTVDLSALTSASGVTVTNNGVVGTVDLSALTDTMGDVVVTNNGSAGIVDLSSLVDAGGSVTVTNNGSGGTVDLSSLSTVGGNATIESGGPDPFDLSATAVTGDLNFTGNGVSAFLGWTPGGMSNITVSDSIGTANLFLPTGTVSPAGGFSIEVLDPASLPPEAGTSATGTAAVVDPIIAAVFSIPSPLNQAATIEFEVDVDALDPVERAQLLAALAAGNLTVAVDAGTGFQALPVCAIGQSPDTDGCALITPFDADRVPLPENSLDSPAFILFEVAITTFSTWAAVAVYDACDPDVVPPPGSPAVVCSLFNHFQCYSAGRTPGTPRYQHRVVTLEDQFETKDVRVVQPVSICTPVNKNGEGIGDPTAHLTCFKITPQGPRLKRDVQMSNQFGEQSLSVLKRKTLCVPSEKDGLTSALTLDHFQCYSAARTPGTPKFQRRVVRLEDQFGTKDVRVVKPVSICTPVNKNGEGILDETAHLTCFTIQKIRGEPPFTRRDVQMSNQFGDQSLRVKRPRTLCVPSTKTLLP